MPDKHSESGWLVRTSVVIIAFVAVAVALIYTRAVMVPFVLAVFIASIVSPLLDWQVIRLKFPRTLAVIASMLVVVFVTALVCLLLASAVSSIVTTAGGSDNQSQSAAKQKTASPPPVDNVEDALGMTASQYTEDLAKLLDRAFDKVESWGIKLDRSAIINDLQNRVPKLVTSVIGTAFGFLSSVLFVTIFVIFLLAGRNPRIVRRGVYAEIDQKIRRYVVTKVVVSVATGVLVWISLRLIGMPLAGVFGLLAFLLNFIPSVGSIISILLPIPVAVANFESYGVIVLVILIPGTIQMVLGNVIEPKVMGEGLNLHPVTILLALSFWGLIWGVVGMLLATPMTAVVRIVLMQFETLRPIGNLLAGQLPGDDKDSA